MDDPAGDLKSLLVRVAEHGDKAAFATLFQHFAPRIRSYGLRHLAARPTPWSWYRKPCCWCGRRPGSIIPTRGCHYLIYTVMRNQGFDMLRRRRASKEELCAEELWPMLEFRAEEEHLSGGEDAVLTRQMAHYVGTLPEPQQQVVRGIYLQELSQQELADRLGVPLGTIKSRLRLALQKLKEQVEQGHD